MTKKTFRVTNMHCSACAITLEGLEDELTGVKRVNASYHRQQIEVEFDESTVTEANIIATVKDMGYIAVPSGVWVTDAVEWICMNKRLIIIATSVGIVALLALTLVAFRVTGQVGNRPVIGAPAPDFELALFSEYRAGLPEKMRLSDLRGQVVVINFWASWCVECKKEAADLEATYRRFKERGVVFIGVDYLDTEKFAYSYLREFDISYANGIDVQQRIAQLYRITGVPETFVVDKNGIIRRVELQRMSAQQLSDAIELALGV